ILAYDIRTGDFIREYVVQGQDLGKEHVVAGIAFDKDDRIYAVDTQQGIIRLTLDGQSQEVYASPLPDLPTCSSVSTGTPCSPTLADNIPIPNDIAFDDNGNLFWTDSFQATIWRVPKGGGQPQIWFQDSRLDSPFFGPNGLRIDPEGNKIYFAQTVTFTGTGRIWTLPLVDHP